MHNICVMHSMFVCHIACPTRHINACCNCEAGFNMCGKHLSLGHLACLTSLEAWAEQSVT